MDSLKVTQLKTYCRPNGTLEFNKPASIGIVEQEQNGVIAPNTIPNI